MSSNRVFLTSVCNKAFRRTRCPILTFRAPVLRRSSEEQVGNFASTSCRLLSRVGLTFHSRKVRRSQARGPRSCDPDRKRRGHTCKAGGIGHPAPRTARPSVWTSNLLIIESPAAGRQERQADFRASGTESVSPMAAELTEISGEASKRTSAHLLLDCHGSQNWPVGSLEQGHSFRKRSASTATWCASNAIS